MPNRSFSLQVVLLLVLYAIAKGVSASQIPLGLDGREQVFIQEHWLDGTPSYCVSNSGKVDQVIQVSRWQSHTLPPLLLNEWDTPAGSVRCHDAREYLGDWLLEFRLRQGGRLGLLKAPMRGKGMAESLPAVASYQSLNAACGSSGLWMEQHKLWSRSGEPLSLILHVTSVDGRIEFDKEGSQGQLPVLPLKKATSTASSVYVRDSNVVIDSGEASEGQKYHSINLQFDTPQVSKPTMMVVSGRRQISDQGWQCFVHGVLLEP